MKEGRRALGNIYYEGHVFSPRKRKRKKKRGHILLFEDKKLKIILQRDRESQSGGVGQRWDGH